MKKTGVSRSLLALLAANNGLLAATLYFSQPLSSMIGADLGLKPEYAGLIVTVTQLGYCLGLLLITPLGDIVENKRLVLIMMCCSAVALIGATSAPSGPSFLAASLLVGVSACAIQMIVPLTAHMTPPDDRGRVIGILTGGLLIGIMLARPIASFVAGFAGWRVLFGVSTVLIVFFIAVLWQRLTPLRPSLVIGYWRLVGSLWTVFAASRTLRKRALSHAALFATFSLFWTAVPWLLVSQGFTQHDIALFALAGAGGAFIAPVAGRLADAGHTKIVTIAAMLMASIAFAVTWRGGPLWLMVVAAIALDAGVQANHVVGQREVLSVDPASRSRMNSVYMSLFFAGAALASAAAGTLFSNGWPAVAMVGTLLPLGALAIYVALS